MNQPKRKRIVFQSNFCKLMTGFAKNKKLLMKYLWENCSDKYEIIELSNGYSWSDKSIKTTPWPNYGTLPDDHEKLKELNNSDDARKNAAGYGLEMIDHAIEELQPDILVVQEDVWAVRGYVEKPWFSKIGVVIHTTLDSLPILKDAVDLASHANNYLVWASFAEKAMHEMGHKHVKTVHGIVDSKNICKLSDRDRAELRRVFGLQDNFLIGFVFRNQLRKSVPNLLDGFKLFKSKNPESKAKLLLHTCFSEGWPIPTLIKEKGIDPKDILTTYVCKKCKNYQIHPFKGPLVQCGFCKEQNSCETTNIKNGVTEKQLNEIYNLLDVLCHAFSSGGQELPIQEAKLAELITLVTDYSCGTDGCSEESGGLPLAWNEYREIGTNFIKASTCPISISNQLEKVYKMDPIEKTKMEKKSRQYVLDNYSSEVVGKKFEEIFDNLPFVDYKYKKVQKECNIYFEPDSSLGDKEWVESLYENILNEKDPNGTAHWFQRLKTDAKREDVLNYFFRVGASNNQSFYFANMLKEVESDKNSKRIAVVVPEKEEEIIATTSILDSLKKEYPDHHIYFFTKPEYFDLISGNPNVYKVLNYSKKMEDPLFFEGKGDSTSYFDIAYLPFLGIRNNNFTRNGKDKIQFEIYK
jgi:glycosyltransferase involved in cell wall biosynthesis